MPPGLGHLILTHSTMHELQSQYCYEWRPPLQLTSVVCRYICAKLNFALTRVIVVFVCRVLALAEELLVRCRGFCVQTCLTAVLSVAVRRCKLQRLRHDTVEPKD